MRKSFVVLGFAALVGAAACGQGAEDGQVQVETPDVDVNVSRDTNTLAVPDVDVGTQRDTMIVNRPTIDANVGRDTTRPR